MSCVVSLDVSSKWSSIGSNEVHMDNSLLYIDSRHLVSFYPKSWQYVAVIVKMGFSLSLYVYIYRVYVSSKPHAFH